MVGQYSASLANSIIFSTPVCAMCSLDMILGMERNDTGAERATIQVDASGIGLGAVLLQNNRPVCYASRTLTSTERRYANIERELLAVIFGCERFHHYVYGSEFTVESDHKLLEMIILKHISSAPARLQRMLLRLQTYQLSIKYRPGRI